MCSLALASLIRERLLHDCCSPTRPNEGANDDAAAAADDDDDDAYDADISC